MSPRRGVRPHDASAAKTLAPVCPANVWGSVPTLRPRPDGTSSGCHREHLLRRRGRRRERGDTGARREGRLRHEQKKRGNRTEREETYPYPFHERKTEERSNGDGLTRHQNPQMGKGRRGTSQGTPQPWRKSVSGRSTETGSTPNLTHIFKAESVTTQRDKRGDATLWSCHQGAMTRQAGRLGDTSWRHWRECCVGCGADSGNRSGPSSSRQ